MTREQINELNMYDAVEQLLHTNTAIWNNDPGISAALATFTSHINIINVHDLIQKIYNYDSTLTKENVIAKMVMAAIAVTNLGKTYAIVTGNFVLFSIINKAKTRIARANGDGIDTICQDIHNSLSPYINDTATCGLTAKCLANFQNLIKAYSAYLGKTILQKQVVTESTLELERHFTAATNLLSTKLDTLVLQYKNSHSAFYDRYTLARVVNNIGHRHSVVLTGFVYDSHNHALPGAIVSLAPIPNPAQGTWNLYHKITNAAAEYKFTGLLPDTFTITVNASGFMPQVKNIMVNTHGIVSTDFKLLPANSTR